MRETPWNVEEMTLEEARTEYDRMRQIARPSTADLRREADLVRFISADAALEYAHSMAPFRETYAEKVRAARAVYAARMEGIGR